MLLFGRSLAQSLSGKNLIHILINSLLNIFSLKFKVVKITMMVGISEEAMNVPK